jgi:hypothetical protein
MVLGLACRVLMCCWEALGFGTGTGCYCNYAPLAQRDHREKALEGIITSQYTFYTTKREVVELVPWALLHERGVALPKVYPCKPMVATDELNGQPLCRPADVRGVRVACVWCVWRACGVRVACAWRVRGVCVACVRGVCVACVRGVCAWRRDTVAWVWRGVVWFVLLCFSQRLYVGRNDVWLTYPAPALGSPYVLLFCRS